MESHIITISIECEVCITYQDLRHGLDFIVSTVGCQAPKYVKSWIESQIYKHFEFTFEEEKERPQEVRRQMEFEVEVFYNIKGDPFKAVCHTVCPEFVQDWVKEQAMKLQPIGRNV